MSEMRGAAVELSEAQLLALYEWMLTGRFLESALLEEDETGRGGFRHPGSGQEAAQVGFASALDPGDFFAGGHRDLLATLVRGVTLEEALLDLFGKAAGPSRGLRPVGAPAPGKGIIGVSAASVDGVAVAVGAALAFHCRAEPLVALALCGEGATAGGVWHEAVNAAAVHRLPVVFAVENNQYAYSLPNESVSPLAYTAHRADGYGIPGIVVDGNDVLEVYAATREAVERARAGEGPSLVEAVTFRQFGHHVGDPAVYVDAEARRSWLARDPLPRYEEFLGSRGLLDETRRSYLQDRVQSRIAQTLDWARRQADAGLPEDAPVGPEGEAPLRHLLRARATVAEALAEVLDEEMKRDEAVVILGPDVGRLGGPHGVTRGLLDRYGPRRVIDFPGAGPGLVGAAVGAALGGLRPVAEVAGHHLHASLGLLAGHAGSGDFPLPLVLRVPCGRGEDSGPGAATALGLKVWMPGSPHVAPDLLAAAVRDPGPVVLLEPVGLYAAVCGQEGAAVRPDRARLVREGADVTVVAWGTAVAAALEAASEAAAAGVGVEVVDLQSLDPIDGETVLESVARTGRLVVASDGCALGEVGAEVAARIAEEGLWHLDAPVRRVGAVLGTQVSSREEAAVPRPADILAAVLALANT